MSAAQVPPSGGPAGAAKESLPHSILELLRELPGLVSDRVQLLSLEMRRARQTLVTMLVLGVVAAVMAATAWVALWLGLAAGLVQLGLHWAWAWILIVALNAGVAAWAVLHAKSLMPCLALPATLRHLTIAPSSPLAPSSHSQEGLSDEQLRSHDARRQQQPVAS